MGFQTLGRVSAVGWMGRKESTYLTQRILCLRSSRATSGGFRRLTMAADHAAVVSKGVLDHLHG